MPPIRVHVEAAGRREEPNPREAAGRPRERASVQRQRRHYVRRLRADMPTPSILAYLPAERPCARASSLAFLEAAPRGREARGSRQLGCI